MELLGGLLAVAFWSETAFSATVENWRCCGFDRQVFRTNPRCAEILGKADDRDRAANLTRLEQAEADREQKAKVDGNQMALEEENLRLKAENASLRRDLDRMKRLSAVIAETGRLP